MKDLVCNLGDKVIKFKIGEFDNELDIDKLLKIDYNNVIAEILTFPVMVNRFGALAADMSNIYHEKKIDLSIFEAKEREKIRQELSDEGEKITIGVVDDRLMKSVKYRAKKKLVYKAEKEKEYLYSIYFAAKDKSTKLDKLSMSLRRDDFDELTVQRQMNNINYRIQEGKIK